MSLCLQAREPVEVQQHRFHHSSAHTTFFVFLPGGGRAGGQAKCAELFDISAAVQSAHLFSLSCTRFAPHHSSFLRWVNLVTSVLLLFLQEVTEPGSVNSSGVSSPRERRGQGHVFGRVLISAEMKGRPITMEFPDQGCRFLGAM